MSCVTSVTGMNLLTVILAGKNMMGRSRDWSAQGWLRWGLPRADSTTHGELCGIEILGNGQQRFFLQLNSVSIDFYPHLLGQCIRQSKVFLTSLAKC